jgi:ligand-binding sensor domain-containing protein
MIKDLRSAYAFCKDDISLIENYDKAIADESNNWVVHHKLGIREDYCNTADELILMNLYFHRPASELIFMTKSEHVKLHNKARIKEIVNTLTEANRNRVWTPEMRKKVSDKKKGVKLGPMTEEHRKKLSEAALRRYNKGV